MPSVRVLIADDSPAVLENVVEMLQEDFVITAAVPDGKSVVIAVAKSTPDVIVLDISLGDMTGFEVARRLREMNCRAKIVFLTVHESVDFVRAAVALGASGYVFKSRADADLVDAINAAFRGEAFLPADYH
ncbi:MAG: response regulator transcription factor [Candidatus Korobacteraceae bacterium]